MKRPLVTLVVAVALTLVASAAWAYWTVDSVPGGGGAAGASTVNQGATPTASAAGSDLTVSWAATTLANGVPVSGYLVKSVAKDSPGDHAGLRGGTRYVTIDGKEMVLGGDIILSVEGVAATTPANMKKVRDHLATLKSGDQIKAVILRAGRVIELTGTAP